MIRFTLLLLLTSCADNYKRPAMIRPEREYYVQSYGWNLPWRIQQAYAMGAIVPGMSREMVENLYGEPDLVIRCPRQSLICDDILVYQTNNTHTVGSAAIRADTVVQATGQLIQVQRF